MNDRYLFRGKSIENEWIIGCLSENIDGVQSIKSIGDIRAFTPVISQETIGQCTGLKDKNGTLIFEGDVVQDDCSWIKGRRIFTVKYSEHFKRLHLIPKEAYPQVSEYVLKNGIHIFDWTFPYMSLTVIGNIHDNPELLKKCEDNS